jgi:hypothetical protein
MARREGFDASRLAAFGCSPPWSLRSHSSFADRSYSLVAIRSQLPPLRFEAGFDGFQETPEIKDFGDLAHIA